MFTYQKLNMIILLDVSGSIGRDLYRQEVETFAVDLVEYGIRKSGLILHPDHARMEVVTFDDLAKIQAYSYNPIHACEVYTRLQQINPGHFDGRTEVHVAFNTTRELFRKTQRPGDRKVLFLVTDGGFTSPPAAVRTSVGNLRALGVEIFTVGVGSLASSWVQRNIDSVVLDDLHILCYDTWSELVKWARDKDVEDITLANVTAAQLLNSCPVCLPHSSCMCAVNIQQYICQCDPGYVNKDGNCQPMKVCEGQCPDVDRNQTTTTHQPPVLEQTLIIAIFIAILVLILLTVAILIVLIRWRRYKKRTPTAPSGVHAVFNFMFLRISNKTVVVRDNENPKCAESNIYVISTSDHNPSDTRTRPCTTDSEVQTPPSVQSQVALYESRLATLDDIKRQRTRQPELQYDATDVRHSSASSHRYLSINPDPETFDEQGYLVPVSSDDLAEPPPSGAGYENLSNMADDYVDELRQLVQQSDLEGAAVFCKEDNSLATAGSIHFRSCDVGHILRLLQSGEPEQGAVIPINGKMHQVKIHHQGSSLYAEETPGDKHSSAIWAIDTERHLVIGIGIRLTALTCEESMDKFAVELAR